ncbi:hypothetical protein KHC28_00885 [Ancylobacter sonchi]|uniref:hypothetical protein n=1 Tax=Ancylobacter sonchi TaxID=1937790 RepID=UPI001BD45C3D|nr:hypothetical protein [Ancylobacter sonchi]MBS7532219.1 hypothetical protein [Ancylobacter sonchi]
MTTNIEARARALCAADLRPSVAAGDLEITVDRLWPVVAREIQGNVMDADATKEPRDIAMRVAEYQQLRRSQSTSV